MKRAHGDDQLIDADLLAPLERNYDRFTKTERKLASYVRSRPNCLILETAQTIASNVGVSPMSVGRFLRKLGYEGLSDVRARLKTDLYGPDGDTLWSVDRRYEAFARRRAARQGRDDSLAAELAAIRRAYELATQPPWTAVVASLAGADRIYVSGLHMARPLALELVTRLEYVRPGVHLSDGQNGHYGEVLNESARRISLVLIDFYRYDRATQMLAQAAKDQGIDVVIVTDAYCLWAREVTEKVFSLPTSTGLFWHSTAAFTTLLNLMVDDVIHRLGDRVPKRLDRVLKMQERLGQFAKDL
jgi:DNA-binding MurR/RpiR family transcriptional regulator